MKPPLFLIVLVAAVSVIIAALIFGRTSQAAPPDPLPAQEFISLHLAGPQGTWVVRIPKGCRIAQGHADCEDPDGTQRLISLGTPPFTIEKAVDSRGVEIRGRPKSLEELKALGIDLSHQDNTPRDLSSVPLFRPPEPEPPPFIAVFPDVPIPGGLPGQRSVDGIAPPNVPVLMPVSK